MFASSVVSNLRDRPILLSLTKECLVILTAVNLALRMFPESAGFNTCSSVKKESTLERFIKGSLFQKKNWKVI